MSHNVGLKIQLKSLLALLTTKSFSSTGILRFLTPSLNLRALYLAISYGISAECKVNVRGTLHYVNETPTVLVINGQTHKLDTASVCALHPGDMHLSPLPWPPAHNSPVPAS